IDTLVLCEAVLPDVWNGVTINSIADNGAIYTGTTAGGCDSTVTLNLTLKPVLDIIDTVVVCSDDLPVTWNGYTISSIADNGKIYNTTSVGGCDSTVTLALTINNTENTTDALVICTDAL